MKISQLPLVSVIIPVFNAENYIEEAIDSILNQTYKSIEIIAVDDGSTDNSAHIISGIKNIKLIRSARNMGVGYARNRAIEICSGDFVSFLDADDLWDKEKTSLQVNILLNETDIDGVFGTFKNFFDQNTSIPPFVNEATFLNPETGKMKQLGTMMVRKKIIDRVGLFSESLKSGEDLDWLVRANDLEVNLHFHSDLLLHRRLHGSNLSYSSFSNKKNLLEIFNNSIKRKRARGK